MNMQDINRNANGTSVEMNMQDINRNANGTSVEILVRICVEGSDDLECVQSSRK